MEGSSRKEEEKDVTERTATFSLYHPCYFFEEAVKSLFKCLGLGLGTNWDSKGKEKKNSLGQAPPDLEEDTESNDHRSSQEQEVLPTSAEEAAHYEYSSTTQGFELVTSMMVVRGGPRRSQLTAGSGPQTN